MIRTLKAALVSLVLAAVPLPSAAGAADRPAKAPATSVNVAHTFFHLPGGESYRVTAENNLRIFALIEPDAIVDRNLAWVRQSNWQAGFKAMFARAVRWARTTRKLGPDELYHLAHEFLAQSKDEGRHFKSIAKRLLGLAAIQGHAQAKREDDVWARKTAKANWPGFHAYLMKRVARGDADALEALGIQYKLARGPKRDLARTYYWFLRARAGARGEIALNVARSIENLERQISSEDRRQAMKWFEDGTVPGR